MSETQIPSIEPPKSTENDPESVDFAQVLRHTQQEIQDEYEKLLSEKPEVTAQLLSISGAVRKQIDVAEELIPKWQESGLLKKLKLTPNLAKSVVTIVLGMVIIDKLKYSLQDEAAERVRENQTWSPEQKIELITALQKAGLVE